MSRLEDTKDFFKNHQDKFILTIGFILLCSISFAAGRLSVVSKSEPISIDESNIFEDLEIEEVETENIKEETEKNTIQSNKSETITENEGVFVGNIENNKFYPFNSEEIGDIPSDNMMWFDSKEEAEEQGYILAETTNTVKSSKTSTEEVSEQEVESGSLGKYVGSKNSDKYHPLDSGSAKRIKEENKVYFKSKEDAESKGYTAGASVKD
ncbi:MAG: hypothetical protein HQ538_03075 [Parcubacteria group bacterium]|nr:hypothetical protein [Parcubacteria group bacterium]